MTLLIQTGMNLQWNSNNINEIYHNFTPIVLNVINKYHKKRITICPTFHTTEFEGP